MIAEISQDLVAKVKSIASDSFGTTTKRVGLAVGARKNDPLMDDTPKPAAWVIFIGDQNVDGAAQGTCQAMIQYNFIVKVVVDYANEKDLIDNQYPLLTEIIKAISGQGGPLGSQRWKYEGQTIDELTSSRLVFDQRYSITAVV